MTVNLCEPILFGFTKGTYQGCAVDVPVSLETVLTTPDDGSLTGDCKHVCADVVFDRGTGLDRVAFDAAGLQCVSGFATLTDVPMSLPIWSKRTAAEGTDVSPARGVLRGNIVTFTSSIACDPTRAVECFDGYPLLNEPVTWVPGACFWYPPHGMDCVYCGEKWDLNCTIESDEPLCEAGGGPEGAQAARTAVLLPGAQIIPDAENWDITGDADPFRAGDGRDGLTRYYLKALNGGVEPNLTPISPWVGWCCTWLCNWTQTGAAGQVWRLFCNEPNQHGPHQQPVSELEAKRLNFAWYPGVQSLVHFNFPAVANCFPHADQYCMTDGGTEAGGTYWNHLTELDPKLTVLDALVIDFGSPETGYCRLSTDQEAYPYAEPEHVAIANDALWEMHRHLDRVDHSSRHSNYDSLALNRWGSSKVFGVCGVKPAVHRQTDPGGDPRTVYVTPYGTDCRFPADLVLDRVSIVLRVSFEPRNITIAGDDDPVAAGVRLPATIEIYLWLKARLRSGWDSIACPVTFANAATDPCDLTTTPTRPVVISADDCSQVPLKIHWRGINGPRPWSRSTYEHEAHPGNSRPCCDYLCALDGLIIPGEVRNTDDPDGPQPYEGEVVLGLVTGPEHLGCVCAD